MEWPDDSSFDAYYVLDMDPVAASRPRVRVIGKGRTVAYYTGKYKTFKEQTAPSVIQSCVTHTFEKGTPLIVYAGFYGTKPRTSKLSYPNPDIDNYLKALFDVMNGTQWYDDRDVVELHSEKAWAEEAGHIRFGIALK